MKQPSKKWTILFLAVWLGILAAVSGVIAVVDPFFHYHKPLSGLFYHILYERNQNNGIVRHFDYDAIVTGTSMAERFKASELDALFGVNSVKVPLSGATYKEINDTLAVALKHHPDTKMIVRPLDMYMFGEDKDKLREDLGVYPDYLYDSNPLNDAPYTLNKEILCELALTSILDYLGGAEGGWTDFDLYPRIERTVLGRENVLMGRSAFARSPQTQSLTEEDKARIYANAEQNVLALAREYPDTEFYYFFPPYSAVWWGDLLQKGELLKQIEAEQYVIELILQCDNILLFSFNDAFEITTDLNNYSDLLHYAEHINSYILQQMQQGNHRITRGNYLEYLNREREFYTNFDYNSLFEQ